MTQNTKKQLSDDRDFLDHFVYFLCSDEKFLRRCAPVLDGDEFARLSGSAHDQYRGIVADCALRHYKKYGKSIGKLLYREVTDNTTRLGKNKKKELVGYLTHLQELKPVHDPRAIADKVGQYQTEVRTAKALDEIIILRERGDLTGEKLIAIGHSLESADNTTQPKVVSAADLLVAEFEELPFTIDQILPTGALTIVAGKKGEGKTTLSLQLAAAVVRKSDFLGRKVRSPGPVLVVTLEDSRSDLQSKLRRIIGDLDSKKVTDLHILDQLPTFPNGIAVLEQQLKNATDAGKPYKVAVIDPFFAVAPQRHGHLDITRADYSEVVPLKKLAKDFGVSIVLVSHSPKAPWADTRDRVLGTTGFIAPADALWIMTRDPEDDAIKRLSISGRSVRDQNLRLELGEGGFEVLEEGVDVEAGPEQKRILRLLKRKGPMFPKEIAKALQNLQFRGRGDE
jgi:hypothetical protein